MAVWLYRFPQEKTTMCVLAAQNSMIIFNKRTEFCCFINILWTDSVHDCLGKKKQKSKTRVWIDYQQDTNRIQVRKASCSQTSNHNQNRRTIRQMELIQSNKIHCLFSDPSSNIQVENNYLLFYLVILQSSPNILGHAVTAKQIKCLKVLPGTNSNFI